MASCTQVTHLFYRQHRADCYTSPPFPNRLSNSPGAWLPPPPPPHLGSSSSFPSSPSACRPPPPRTAAPGRLPGPRGSRQDTASVGRHGEEIVRPHYASPDCHKCTTLTIEPPGVHELSKAANLKKYTIITITILPILL